jgi:hypothetical protein
MARQGRRLTAHRHTSGQPAMRAHSVPATGGGPPEEEVEGVNGISELQAALAVRIEEGVMFPGSAAVPSPHGSCPQSPRGWWRARRGRRV